MCGAYSIIIIIYTIQVYNNTETTCVCAPCTRDVRSETPLLLLCRYTPRGELLFCWFIIENLSGGFSYNMRKLKPPRCSRREKRRFTIVKKKNQKHNKIIQTNDAGFEGREKNEVLKLGVQSFRTASRRNAKRKRSWGGKKITRIIQLSIVCTIDRSSRVECVGHDKHYER